MDHDAWQPPDGGTVTRTPDGAYRTDWDLRTNLRSRSRYFTDERIKGEANTSQAQNAGLLGAFSSSPWPQLGSHSLVPLDTMSDD